MTTEKNGNGQIVINGVTLSKSQRKRWRRRRRTVAFNAERLRVALLMAQRAAKDLYRTSKDHDCPRKGKHGRKCVACHQDTTPDCEFCELRAVVWNLIMDGHDSPAEFARMIAGNIPGTDFAGSGRRRLRSVEALHRELLRRELNKDKPGAKVPGEDTALHERAGR